MPSHPDIPPGEISGMAADPRLSALTREWFNESARHRYSYHFSWLGRPIIQYPQDLMAMQELIWRVKPDLIVETGIAHGGSLIFYASMLALTGGPGRVLGIDIEIRPENREAIESHPMMTRIELLEGSSTDPAIAARAIALAQSAERVMVVLDSNHTHAHVAAELALYAPLVTVGSYLVVFDTVVEEMPPGSFPNRPWDRGDNPRTAVDAFLASHPGFSCDKGIEEKLLITVAPGGYLRRDH